MTNYLNIGKQQIKEQTNNLIRPNHGKLKHMPQTIQLKQPINTNQTKQQNHPRNEQQGEQDNEQNSSQTLKDKIRQFATQLDFFSYVPQPQAYPVSTSKSKIGSIVFLILVTSYLTYDFVKFMINNQPLVNSYQTNIPLDELYQSPQIAFGFIYGPGLNYTLNDPSYFSYQMLNIQSFTANGSTSQNRTQLSLVQNCNPQWLGVYNKIYQNLTCIQGSPVLMNVPSQSPSSIIQRLLVTICQPSQNITCQSQIDIFKMTSGGRLFLIINLPAGFDYNTGTVKDSDYSVQIYNFFLVPGLYNRINIDYWPFEFTTYPTYFTSWTNKHFSYMQSYQPLTKLSNVSTFNPYVMIGVTFQLYAGVTVVQVKYQTFINRVSEWGALASLIMTIFGICCLTYNKKKFLQKNPTWSNFDQALKTKQKIIEIQMQANTQKDMDILNINNQKGKNEDDQDDDYGGMAQIRRKLQQNKKL